MVNSVFFLISGVLECKGLNQNGEDCDDLVVMLLCSLESCIYGLGELLVIVVVLCDMGVLVDSVVDIIDVMICQYGCEDFWLIDVVIVF